MGLVTLEQRHVNKQTEDTLLPPTDHAQALVPVTAASALSQLRPPQTKSSSVLGWLVHRAGPPLFKDPGWFW